ncbi:MAG: hypothetical protein MPK10_03650, partial [Gammaproteobacteria bacterium]|nr:hypothetical protein [Gammaproteobacteria bacterium]
MGPLPPGAGPDEVRPEEPLVWIDGGANHRDAGGSFRGGFAVGDGDSAPGALDQDLSLPLLHNFEPTRLRRNSYDPFLFQKKNSLHLASFPAPTGDLHDCFCTS